MVEAMEQKLAWHVTLETQMPASQSSQRPNSYCAISKSKLLFVSSLLSHQGGGAWLLPKEKEPSSVICQSGFCLLLSSLPLLGSRQTLLSK